MQFGHDFAQPRRVGGLDGAGNLLDEFVTDLALFVPHREAIEHGECAAGWATSISSAMPRLAGLTE